jgi:hypothetical protein
MSDDLKQDVQCPLQTMPQHAEGRQPYDPPRLRSLGRVCDITLGSAGPGTEGGSGFPKALTTAG